MNILLLGTMVPKQTQDYCFKHGQRPSAADTAQKYIMNGLEELDEVASIDAIGSVRMKMWPKSKIIKVGSCVDNRTKGIVEGIGYINLAGLGFVLRERAIVRAAKKWADRNKNSSDVVVLIYSMHSPFMRAAKEVKKIIPSSKIIMVVADLPLFMDMRGSIRRMLKKIDWRRICRLRTYVDKYLLYTKYMADYLELDPNDWMLFEGLIDEAKIIKTPQEKNGERFVLYAGNLDSRYGIDTLIGAFSLTKTKAKLLIYGSGFDKERIAQLTQSMSKVEYCGQVSSEKIFEIMKMATILVNPRPTSIGLAKYSCPSKTFEYMASGTPIIMNKLPGLPEDYYPYISFFNDETEESYARAIDAMMDLDASTLSRMGMDAANYLRENKNSRIVMKKVIAFIRQ